MYADDTGRGYTSNEINQVLELAQNELMNLPDDYSDVEYVNHLQKEINVLQDMLQGKLDEADSQLAWEVLNKNVKRDDGALLHQTVNTAGADSSAEISAAKKEWEEKGTESKYFKKWFGDSKVVDEDGKPLVVYHGTRDVFDTFDVNKKGKASEIARVGFWFSDRKNFAENFARDIWWGEQEKPVVMPVYLSMQNPKIYKNKNISKEELSAAEDKVDEIENKIKELNRQFNKIVQETGSFYKATEAVEKPRELLKAELEEAKNVYAELRYSDPYEQLRTDIRKMEGGNAEDANFGGLGLVLKDPESVERFVDSLKTQGYDGIIIQGTTFDSEVAETDNNNQYAVFYPEQIKSVDNQGTFDETNPNIYYQDANNISFNFKSFEELQEAFENDIEQTPEDYKISDLNEALKDLAITENKPKEVKTPYETIQVRARNIEHIINSKGDKSRYKSINRMFATLERPNVITIDKQGKRAYFKIFAGNNKTKRQITYVSTDEQGNFVLTTIPIKRNKKFINAINKGNIIYESRKGVINNSPDNNSITDVGTDFNPNVKNNVLFQSAYHGTPHRFDEFSTEHIGTGEGAQAHGWGLYFAGNKEVSEGYRKTLTNRYSSTQYEYKNKTYTVLYDDYEDLYIKEDTSNLNETEKDLILDLAISDSQEELLEELKDTKQNYEEEIVTVVKNGKSEEYTNKDYDKERYNRVLSKIKILESGEIKTKKAKGQLFEVDIPEDDVLLDEDKTYEEQPKEVQKALSTLVYKEKMPYNILNGSGRDIYDNIRNWQKDAYNPDKKLSKEASLLLNKYGIKGIKYDGRQDGECYVIFDAKAVDVLKTYYQEINPEQQNIFPGNRKAKEIHKVKGGYLPAEKFIELFKNADASTIVHELAHWYLDELTRVAQYSEEIAQDLEAVRKYLKNEGEDFTREQHEKFARSFEAYLYV